jgi:iron complex outermembrane receptor protein
MQSIVSRRLSRSILICSTAITMSLVSSAAGAEQTERGVAAAGAPAASEVVVTGSRIARRDFTAPSPIVTVNSQSFENRSGPEIEQNLNQLPQFHTDANSQLGQAQGGQPSASQTPGASFLNLRGLGANRNLVLIDGRRAQPSNGQMVVDVNTIPVAAIDGVEIVTGGASAVYGADAVSGVVNFKLKHNFQGLELDAQYGISQRGDNREPNVSAVFGTNFADNRGNVMFSAMYTQRSPVYAKDRPFYAAGYNDPHTNAGGSYPFLPYAGFDWGNNASFVNLTPFFNAPSPAALNAVLPGVYGSPFAQNSVSVNPDQSLFYSGVGANGAQVPGYTGPLLNNSGFKIQNSGTLGYSFTGAYLSPESRRWGLFGSANFAVNEHITAYLQGNYAWQQIRTLGGSPPAVQFWGASVPVDGQHPVPPALAALLASRPQPTEAWALELTVDHIVGPARAIETTNTYQIVAGLKGDLPFGDWQWDLYGSQGQTDYLDFSANGNVSVQAFRKFVNAPNYGADATISQASLQNAHCTSGFYNAIFKGQLPSQDCIDAVSAHMHNSTSLEQKVVEFNSSGTLFKLPGGELKGSFGADYRENDFSFTADPLLEVSNVVDAPVGLFPTSSTQGRINVKEGYGELLVPIVRDLPFVEAFNVSLGARYSSYGWRGRGALNSVVGGTNGWTYKILGDFKVNDWITFRGGFQRAERAPNVAELFQPNSPVVVFASSGDPCANPPGNPGLNWNNSPSNPHRLQTQQLCLSLIQKTNPTAGSTFYVPGGSANTYNGLFPFFFPITIDQDQGNPNLHSEVAKSYTAGAVFRSPWKTPLLARTTVSVDWYDIQIAGAIIPLTSETLYEQCLNADGHSNPSLTITGNPFCNFILREAVTGGNRTAINPYFNFSSLETEGVDVQLDWGAELADMGLASVPGSLRLNFVFNWIGRYGIQASLDQPVLNYAGTGDQFRYRTFTTLSYNNSRWNLGMRWKHWPGAKSGASVLNPATTVLGPGAHDEFDLFSGVKLNDSYSLRFGVDNLFDKDPEVVGRDIGPAPNAALGSTSLQYDALGRRFYVAIKARF